MEQKAGGGFQNRKKKKTFEREDVESLRPINLQRSFHGMDFLEDSIFVFLSVTRTFPPVS